ncbi:hypothetical protein SNEBB_003125 [Seison nebaliae]|nr:hypothetical protein SNEBB_003125 [Seison nebaliae]
MLTKYGKLVKMKMFKEFQHPTWYEMFVEIQHVDGSKEYKKLLRQRPSSLVKFQEYNGKCSRGIGNRVAQRRALIEYFDFRFNWFGILRRFRINYSLDIIHLWVMWLINDTRTGAYIHTVISLLVSINIGILIEISSNHEPFYYASYLSSGTDSLIIWLQIAQIIDIVCVFYYFIRSLICTIPKFLIGRRMHTSIFASDDSDVNASDLFFCFIYFTYIVFEASYSYHYTVLDLANTYNTDVKKSTFQQIYYACKITHIFFILTTVNASINMRVLAISITKALASIVSLGLLIIFFMLSYGIACVIVFHDYWDKDLIFHPANKQKILQNSIGSANIVDHRLRWSTLPQAMITLFQMITLDGWRSILDGIIVDVSTPIVLTILISWIIFANLIFANIFVGIMVNNFQEIRLAVIKRYTELHTKLVEEKRFENFLQKMTEHDERGSVNDSNIVSVVREGLSQSVSFAELGKKAHFLLEDLDNRSTEYVDELYKDAEQWRELLSKNLNYLANAVKDEPLNWAEDAYFWYHIILMHIIENVEESMILQDYTKQVLLNLFDDIDGTIDDNI